MIDEDDEIDEVVEINRVTEESTEDDALDDVVEIVQTGVRADL